MSIRVNNLKVVKQNQLICSVNQLEIDMPGRCCIVGANGVGKTTLLRVLAGLETVFDGSINVNVAANERVLVQQSPIMFARSVFQNIEYGLIARSVPKPERKTRVNALLERFDLKRLANHDARPLSGGEKRRVALARAIVLKPKLLLLDEPFADLDDTGKSAVSEWIDAASETTVLIATPTRIDGDYQQFDFDSVSNSNGPA